jgi:hypothetical protein
LVNRKAKTEIPVETSEGKFWIDAEDVLQGAVNPFAGHRRAISLSPAAIMPAIGKMGKRQPSARNPGLKRNQLHLA